MTGPIFVDTNVILDVATRDPRWYEWSLGELSRAQGPLVINPIVFAEISAGYPDKEALDDMLAEFERETIPWDAAFLAGQAHAAYRLRGGGRDAILADFLIGAHAAVQGYALLSRDPRRYLLVYPGLNVIAPRHG
jgi:predicted nucleic acid-binding protein